ncbi:hypothetical protein [Enterococcus sp. LJL128]
MNETQKKVIELLDSATPSDQLEPWLVGRIPQHYRRISIERDEQIRLARIGASQSLAFFGSKPYFTQAMLIGAVQGGYSTIKVVTPSQYGKSYTCGQIALLRANEGNPVRVAGNDAQVTEIIMKYVADHLQHADISIRVKMMEPADKVERLQMGMSKKKIALKGGGMIEAISLGGAFNDTLRSNAAIGRGGDYIVDEAALVPDAVYAEMGRREFSSEDGKKLLSFEISNPHRKGRFYDSITADDVPEDTLIVWMDARTALEEGRYKSKEQIINSEFFKEESTAKRYLLCELDDYADKSLFNEIVVNDGPIHPDTIFFLGIDSAHKGKDNIDVVLSGLEPSGMVRVLDFAVIDKSDWIDGVTSFKVIDDIMKLVTRFDVKKICVDIGFGIWLVEGLAKKLGNKRVQGINFGEGTTKTRKELNHFAAVRGFNKRAEMHVDLQQLISSLDISFTSKMKDALEEQMNYVQSLIKSNGKIAIISKDEIKKLLGKSPDELDAVLLSVHAILLHSIDNSE